MNLWKQLRDKIKQFFSAKALHFHRHHSSESFAPHDPATSPDPVQTPTENGGKASRSSFKDALRRTRLFQWYRAHRKLGTVLAAGALVVLIGGTAATVFAVEYFQSILPQEASFQGVSLGGMNEKEVEAVLEEQINPRFHDAAVTVQFLDNPQTIRPEDYHFHFTGEDVFQAAKECDYKAGEQPNPPVQYDQEAFDGAIANMVEQTRIAPTASSYQQQGANLVVSAGAPGLQMVQDATGQDVLSSIQSMTFGGVTAPTSEVLDDTIPIHIDAIHDAVAHPVQNASYSINDAGKLSYQDEVVGVDFDVAAASRIITDPNVGQYVIPLTLTNPTVTKAQLKQQHDSASCPSQLSTYTTTFSTSDKNRNYNIAKAAAAINNTVLYPGEAFSALDLIGPASAAQGYKESAVYTPDGPSQGAGGGVCQVSTTAYLAAVYGYMDITERHCHSYTVGYVPLGFDAAFSAGGTDLKFKNTRQDPVRVVASTTDTSITVSIMGTPSDMDNYHVTMTSQVLQTIAPSVEQVPTPSLPSGTTKVDTAGKNGYVVNAHKTVTKDGVVVSEEDIPSSYKAVTEKLLVGTGPAAPPTPQPEEQPSAPPADSSPASDPTNPSSQTTG